MKVSRAELHTKYGVIIEAAQGEKFMVLTIIRLWIDMLADGDTISYTEFEKDENQDQ